MAEGHTQYVTLDQFRAELASLDRRTELIAQDFAAWRRETTERFERLDKRMDDLRKEMQTFRTANREETMAFRQEMRTFRNNTVFQVWVLVCLMLLGVFMGLIKYGL